MSNSAALALIAASTFIGTFVYFYTTKLANDTADEIVMGVIRGVPISKRHRSTLLYQNWFGYLTGAVVCGIFSGILNVRIAAIVSDENVKSVAYVAAVIGFGAAAFWVASAVSDFLYYRSVLSQAEAD